MKINFDDIRVCLTVDKKSRWIVLFQRLLKEVQEESENVLTENFE